MLCSSLKAQENYSIKKENNQFIIEFNDELIGASWDIEGIKIKSYGELVLTKKEYKTLIKDIKNILDLNNKEIDRDSYSVFSLSWIKDSVWVSKNAKAFGVTKSDIKGPPAVPIRGPLP